MFENLSKIKIKGDGIIWMVFFFLCIISILEVYSSSSVLGFKGGSYWKPAVYHAALLLVGLGFLIVTMNIKCRYFKIVTPFALLISFIALIAVYAVGQSTNGAQRWIPILGFQFQPSELAKGAVVLTVAQILSAMQTVDGADRHAFKYILIVSLPYIILIASENFSTAALLFLVVILMMFIGRVPKTQLGKLIGVVMIAGAIGLASIMIIGNSEEEKEKNAKMSMTEQVENVDEKKAEKTTVFGKFFHRANLWKTRILKFFNSEELPPDKVDIQNEDAQVSHANIAIASSNVIGKGPGNSVERDFLAQAFSDFIFAIIIEELGVWGAAIVCLLYIVLLFRTATIANRCVNAFPALLIMGVALLMVTQAMFNMAVAVGLAPVTGQPLPLISKGGTSTIVNCIYIGIILSVSCTAKRRTDGPKQPTIKSTLNIA